MSVSKGTGDAFGCLTDDFQLSDNPILEKVVLQKPVIRDAADVPLYAIYGIQDVMQVHSVILHTGSPFLYPRRGGCSG